MVVTGILVILIVASAAAVTFNGDTEKAFRDAKKVELSYEEPGLEGNVTVTYYNVTSGKSKIGSSDKKPWNVSFDTGVNEYGSFNLSANASNSSHSELRYLNLTVDTVKPAVDSISHTRNGDGTVLIDFSANDTHTGLGKARLFRKFNGTEEKVNSTDLSDAEEDIELVDANQERLYGTGFEYRVEVEDRAGNVESQKYSEEVFPKDRLPPRIASRNIKPGDKVNPSKTEHLKITVDDRLSGLESVNVSLLNTEVVENGIDAEAIKFKLNISNLDDLETYYPAVTAADEIGNTVDYQWNFTVDRTGPDLSGSLRPGTEFLTEKTSIVIYVGNSDVSDVSRMECLVDGQQFGKDVKPNKKNEYSCGPLNPGKFKQGKHSISGRFYDQVGNPSTIQIGTYRFDTSRPVVTSLEPNPKYYWKIPEFTAEAEDQGSAIDEGMYRIDGGKERSIVPEEETREASFSFTPQIELEEGKHELEVRAEDRSGKKSGWSSTTFYYRPETRPKPVLDYSMPVLPPEEPADFEVEVTNEGRSTLLSGKISVSGEAMGESESFKLEPDSSKNVSLKMEPDRKAGVYNASLRLESEAIDMWENMTVAIRASEEQKERIDQKIQGLKEERKKLEEKLQELREKGFSEKAVSRIENRIKELEDGIQGLESEVEEDQYYRAAHRMEKVEGKRTAASAAVEQAKERRERQRLFAVAAILAVLVVGGGGGLWLSRTDSRYLNYLKNQVSRYAPHINPGRLVPHLGLRSLLLDFVPFEMIKIKIGIIYYRTKNKVRKRRKGVEWKGFS